ncbi:MAG TPA: TonB-dependent receptor [Steroidobacteraceae bacterium]|nr:TonB-dependent receptor [Steroidobacteraceae bacterium]
MTDRRNQENGQRTGTAHSAARRIAVAAVGLGLLPVTTQAQEPGARALEEVTVTATRRPTTLLRYPGSVSRIGQDALAIVGPTHHAEIMNRASGVMIQRNSGQESLTAVRSPVLTGPGSCGAFLFLEDGIPIRPVGFCNVNELFEVNTEQASAIEILRGPSSAIYGSSGMHGAINVLTPDPVDLPRIGVGVEAGPDDYGRLRLALSHTGMDTDVGVAAHATHDGGWRDDSGYDEQKMNAALVHRGENATSELKLTATNLDQETAGFIQGEDAYKDPTLARSNPNPEAFRKAHSVRLRGRTTRTVGGSNELTAQAYVRSSRMEFLQHFLLGQPLEENGQDSVGLMLSVARDFGERSQLLAGTDVELARMSLLQVQDGPTLDGPPIAQAIRPAGRHYDYEVDSVVTAAWMHIEHPLSTNVTATLGARLEYVQYDYDNLMIAGNTDEAGNPCPFGGCLYNRPADREDDFTNLTPKLGLSWQYAEAHSVYVSATRGYRAPETTELYRLQRQQNVADLDSEQIDALELGVRGRLADFGYSVAGYTMIKDNVILRDAQGFNVDDGRTRHRGIEYELTWSPLEPLTLSAAGTYARHTYDFDGFEGSEPIVSGRDVDTAPRHLHSFRAAWQANAALGFELEWEHVGEYWLDASNAHQYEGHDLVNLRAAWQPAPEWMVFARVNNLTDEAYADRADFAFGSYRYFPGRERSLFIEVRYALE